MSFVIELDDEVPCEPPDILEDATVLVTPGVIALAAGEEDDCEQDRHQWSHDRLLRNLIGRDGGTRNLGRRFWRPCRTLSSSLWCHVRESNPLTTEGTGLQPVVSPMLTPVAFTSGTPCQNRTGGLLIRSQAFSSTELTGHPRSSVFHTPERATDVCELSRPVLAS